MVFRALVTTRKLLTLGSFVLTNMRTFVFEYFVKTKYRIGVLFTATH